MSQDIDICAHENLENTGECIHSGAVADNQERNISSGQHASTSGRTDLFETEQLGCREENDFACKSPPKKTGNEVPTKTPVTFSIYLFVDALIDNFGS